MARRTGRIVLGVMLMSVSIPWFFYALGIAFRESSFANAIGYTIPFVFLEISIYLLVNGMVDGRFGVVLALAVCGLIVAIGGVGTYIFTSTWFRAPFLAPVWTALGTIGFLLMVPLAIYVARRAKTR
ncbi:hypothetical protein AUG86_02020 [Euryarchaeota archaeon 13_1_20CM_4_64_14]|nr:MAG: hypothetical protein AUG86_02020 [Euryarchaeota archaeon 13_1_20CM_4_64_14]OLE56388.1 MAG: hypothetical protein AUF72_00650 [Euryarchaeota archaeon 13_1_20CM_2_64_92]TLZ80395.1 MAG: hypothetical protein E6K07_00995 [Euryarchaeota archaeon]TLZ90032.1 MAG: hypothetical protein E6K01_04685 [Euryarchaeota archaeon]